MLSNSWPENYDVAQRATYRIKRRFRGDARCSLDLLGHRRQASAQGWYYWGWPANQKLASRWYRWPEQGLASTRQDWPTTPPSKAPTKIRPSTVLSNKLSRY